MSTASWPFPAPARALVVGINAYQCKGIRNLHGCVADAEAVARALREQGGMAADAIRLLTSPAADPTAYASRDAIIAGFRSFLAGAAPGSEALFYYSGHGSTCHLSNELAFGDGVAESLVPADARCGEVVDLLDRELRLLAAELVERGIRVTVWSDACHAGGVLRGEPEPPPPAEPAPRLTGPAHGVRDAASILRRPGEDGPATLARLAALYQSPLDEVVLLAAAQGTQQSWEVPLAEGTRGAMTLALLDTLPTLGGAVNHEELVRVLRARLPEFPQRAQQQPDASGATARGLFGTLLPPRDGRIFVVQRAAESFLLLDGGMLDGVRVGAILNACEDWRLEGATGEWEVTHSFGQRARAVPRAGAGAVGPGQPLRLEAGEGLGVHFHPGSEPLRALWQRPLLQQEPAWERVAAGDVPAPGWMPRLLEVPASEAAYHVHEEAEQWVVRRAGGEVVPGLALPLSRIGEMATQLERALCFDEWVQRELEERERLPLPISLGEGEGLLLAGGRMVHGVEEPLAWSAQSAPLPPSVLQLRLHNGSEQPLYVALYRLDPARWEIERVWPGDGPGELRPDGSAHFQLRHQQNGHLHLQLLVSSSALVAPRWPCGEPARRNLRATVAAPVRGAAVRRVTVGMG